jgi:hypothetical protein
MNSHQTPGATVARRAIVAYVSHRLHILTLPDSPAYGQWIQLPDLSPDWFRRVDPETAAWLSGSLAAAIRSGRLSDRSSEAEAMLEEVLRAGRASGQLPAGPLPTTDLSVSWYSGCPRELVDCHGPEDFPTGVSAKRGEVRIPEQRALKNARTAAKDLPW